MKLNEKILKAMESVKPRNIERFDKMGLDMLHDSVKSEELSLLEFTTLADIYDVPYTFIINTEVYIYVINDKDILWNEIDKLYYKLTCRRINSGGMTLSELQECFKRIGAGVNVE